MSPAAGTERKLCVGARARRGGGPGHKGPALSLQVRSLGPSSGERGEAGRGRNPQAPPWPPQGRPSHLSSRFPYLRAPSPSWGARVPGAPGLSEGLGSGEPSARLSQWEGRARGLCGGRGRRCGRAAGGREPGGGGRSPRGARRVNPSAAGPSSRRSPSRWRRSGCRRSGREPGARRSGRRSAARRRGGGGPAARLGPADRCAGGRAARAQAAPGRAHGPEPAPSGDPAPAPQSGPRPCSAWPRGAGTTAGPGHRKPVLGRAGPGWVGVRPARPWAQDAGAEGPRRAAEHLPGHHHPQV